MKKKRFSVEQIVGVLKQAEVGVPVVEVIRKAGISEQTFYRWKTKYAGPEVDQVRQMAQLQEENIRLKQLVAELTLDKTMLQDVLSKNGEAFAAWTDDRSADEQLWSEYFAADQLQNGTRFRSLTMVDVYTREAVAIEVGQSLKGDDVVRTLNQLKSSRGVLPIGYELRDRQVVINSVEAEQVRQMYRTYLKLGCVSKLQEHLEHTGVRSKRRTSRTGRVSGGAVYSRGALYDILQSRFYRGEVTHKGASYPGQHPAIVDTDLWDTVQTQFQDNLQAPRKRPPAAVKSLLIGLLYDPQGNRFTPSHAAKGANRYRYNVSQTVINKTSEASDGPTRLPANELEELVLSQIQSLLQSPQRMQDVLCGAGADPEEIQRAAERAQKWAAATPSQVRAVLPSVLERVVIHAADYLNPRDPCFSAKLYAAIGAWSAVKADPSLSRGKTVKTALVTWLSKHAAQYGLTKDDGAPNNQAIEEVSKIANWVTKGGAPKTPA